MGRKRLLTLLMLLLATGCLRPEVWRGEAQPTIAQPTTQATRPTETPEPQVVEPSPIPSIYVVQPGDTLSEIAAEHGTTVAELVALNSDRYPSLTTNPSLVRVSWELRVPGIAFQTPEVIASPQIEKTPPPSPAVRTFDAVEAEEQIVSLVNQARAQGGLGLLAIDAVLVEMALQRSQDMIARNYFSHDDPETGEALARKLLDRRGYTNYTAAENIGLVQNETGFVPAHLVVAARYDAHEIAQRFVEGWLESPEHRENILGADFNRTGCGIAISPAGRRIVATQLFLRESHSP